MYYTQDTSEVRDLQEDIDEIREEQYIAQIEEEIDLLEKEKEILEERKEEIEEYYEKLISETKAYYDEQKKAVEEYYQMLIENLEKQKSKFEELKELQEEAEMQALFERYGINGEALLAGSEEEFEKLKNMYVSIADALNSTNTMSQETIDALAQIGIVVDGSIVPSISKTAELGGAFGDLSETISSIDLSNISDGLNSIDTSSVTDGLNELADSASDFGKGFVEGFNSGIEDNGSLTDEVVQAYEENNIETPFHDGSLVFGSPSTTMKDEYGKGFIDGFNNGIEEYGETTKDYIDSWVDSIIAEIELKFGEIDTSVLTGFKDSLVTALAEATESSLVAVDAWGQAVIDNLDNILGTGGDQALISLFDSLNNSLASIDFTPLLTNIQTILDAFNNLQTVIQSVSTAIGGGGSDATSQASASASSAEGGMGSLTSAMETFGETTNTVMGGGGEEGEEGGEGVIGQFDQLNTLVTDTTSAIGSGEEGGGGEGEGGTLIDSIVTLGETVDEEVGTGEEEDTINGKFQKMSSIIEDAELHVQGVINNLDALNNKTVTCTIEVNIVTNGSFPSFAGGALGGVEFESKTFEAHYGKAFANGTAGKAFARGRRNYGLKKSEQNALRSEYGQPELTVYPDGSYELTTSPTFADLPKGTVIYPEDMTREIMKRNKRSNGRAFADGAVSFGGGSHTLSEINDMASRLASTLKAVNPAMQTFGHVLETTAQKMTSLVNKTTTTNNSTSINIGDIHVHEVENANDFAKVVIQQFPNAMLQELGRA